MDAVLSQHFFFHDYVTLEIEFSFVPEGAVGKMILACGGAYGKLFRFSFIMRSSFIPAGFGGFSFRIWHNLKLLEFYFSFFSFSHRGSMSSDSSVGDVSEL